MIRKQFIKKFCQQKSRVNFDSSCLTMVYQKHNQISKVQKMISSYSFHKYISLLTSVSCFAFLNAPTTVAGLIPLIYWIKLRNDFEDEIDSIQAIGLDQEDNLFFLFFNENQKLVWQKIFKDDLIINSVHGNHNEYDSNGIILSVLGLNFKNHEKEQIGKILTLKSQLDFENQINAKLLKKILPLEIDQSQLM